MTSCLLFLLSCLPHHGGLNCELNKSFSPKLLFVKYFFQRAEENNIIPHFMIISLSKCYLYILIKKTQIVANYFPELPEYHLIHSDKVLYPGVLIFKSKIRNQHLRKSSCLPVSSDHCGVKQLKTEVE